jgi:ABC-type methionine transport system ATPase subunit
VTHQIQYLKTADTILVMHQGKITHEGNFDYIMKSCEDISSFLIAESDDEEDDIEEEKKVETSDGKYFYISTISGIQITLSILLIYF